MVPAAMTSIPGAPCDVVSALPPAPAPSRVPVQQQLLLPPLRRRDRDTADGWNAIACASAQGAARAAGSSSEGRHITAGSISVVAVLTTAAAPRRRLAIGRSRPRPVGRPSTSVVAMASTATATVQPKVVEETDAADSHPAPLPLRVKGRWVDASAWQPKHPGGSWMLRWCKGMDVTNIFGMIHAFAPEKAHDALAQLPDLAPEFVPQASRQRTEEGWPRISPVLGGTTNYEDKFYAFLRGQRQEDIPEAVEVNVPQAIDLSIQETPLIQDLQAMLQRHFPGGPSEAKADVWQWSRILFFFHVVIWGWAGWLNCEYLPTLVLPWATWLLFSQSGHEGLHGALSINPLVNQVGMFSSHPIILNAICWFHGHVISHHQYTNDPARDADLHHHRPARMHPELPLDPGTTGGIGFLLKTYLCTCGLSILHPVRELLQRPTPRYAQNVTPMPGEAPRWLCWLSVIPSIVVAAIPFFLHLPRLGFLPFLFFWVYPWVVASLCFGVLTQVNHIQEDCQQPPADTDFLRWQVESAVDYSVDDDFITVITAGTNMQSLHHVFPTVALCHFPKIYPEYAEICRKHGVRLNRRKNLWEAWQTCVDYAYDLSDPAQLESGDGAASSISQRGIGSTQAHAPAVSPLAAATMLRES